MACAADLRISGQVVLFMLLATAVYAKLWHGYDDAAHRIEVRCVDVVPMCAAAVAVWTLLFVAFFLNPSYVWAALT